MTLAKWEDAVRIAKIKLNEDPDSFMIIKGKLLKEAQMVYALLLADER